MGKFTLVSKEVQPLQDSVYAHGGTGAIANTRHVVVPSSVDRGLSEPLEIAFARYSIRVMSFTIDTTQAPNWYAVAFRQGIRSFHSVNIFCHPNPQGAGMIDSDYQAHSGNWPRLFRYAEGLGSQIDMAHSDQVVIVPMFNNASYGDTGIFGPNWKDIVEQILQLASARASSAATSQAAAPTTGKVGRTFKGEPEGPADFTPGLKDVVLSDFSRGRQLMWAVRKNAPGLSAYLREVWDFDGNAGPAPISSQGVRGILYDQGTTKGTAPNTFHVPVDRWVNYLGARVEALKKLPPEQRFKEVHPHIVGQLARHAATISHVGRP